jgi:hypothetical protein
MLLKNSIITVYFVLSGMFLFHSLWNRPVHKNISLAKTKPILTYSIKSECLYKKMGNLATTIYQLNNKTLVFLYPLQI